MVLGLTVIARFGATGGSPMGNEPWVFQEQLTKAEACAQIATKPAARASVRERDLLSFDTCMARACHRQTRRSGTLSVRVLCTPGCTAASVRAFSSVYARITPLTREGTGGDGIHR
jgi:hypothetical protein